jgi:hypothetical protein
MEFEIEQRTPRESPTLELSRYNENLNTLPNTKQQINSQRKLS